MFVKVGFVTGEAGRILVPAGSLVERSEVTAVYVVDAAGRPSLRQVRVGERIDDRVEVLSGLAPGERVALDPLAAIKELTPVTVAARSNP
jgi:multidrug efflux pump subunit AcrA (membrane-fusion protein)